MKQKTILVTGGAGFIGGNFVLKQMSETENLVLKPKNVLLV